MMSSAKGVMGAGLTDAKKFANSMHRTSSRQMANEWLEVCSAYEERSLEQILLHILSLPILIIPAAIWPPMLQWAEEAPPTSFWRHLRIPPRSRFWVYEISCLSFAILLSFADLPITRGAPDPSLDWVIVVWALALFFAQGQFINAVGLEAYLYDTYNLVEMVVTVGAFGMSMLNVCNPTDWIFTDVVSQTREELPAGGILDHNATTDGSLRALAEVFSSVISRQLSAVFENDEASAASDPLSAGHHSGPM
jgi:hypothetical protein